MPRGVVAVLLAALVAVGTACVFDPTDPLGRYDSLKRSHRRYTQLVRWGQIEKAIQFVEPEQRDEFLAVAEAFGDVRVTDYEVRDFELDEGSRSATIRVTYSAYLPWSPVEKQFHEIQRWNRKSGSVWRVRPELATFRAMLGERAHN